MTVLQQKDSEALPRNFLPAPELIILQLSFQWCSVAVGQIQSDVEERPTLNLNFFLPIIKGRESLLIG